MTEGKGRKMNDRTLKLQKKRADDEPGCGLYACVFVHVFVHTCTVPRCK